MRAACVRLHRGTLSGAEDHVRLPKEYIDLSFDEIYLHSAAADHNAFLRRYARDVLPKVT